MEKYPFFGPPIKVHLQLTKCSKFTLSSKIRPNFAFFFENRTEIYTFYENRFEIYTCILFENTTEISNILSMVDGLTISKTGLIYCYRYHNCSLWQFFQENQSWFNWLHFIFFIIIFRLMQRIQFYKWHLMKKHD